MIMRFLDFLVFLSAFITVIFVLIVYTGGGIAPASTAFLVFGGITYGIYLFRNKVDPR